MPYYDEGNPMTVTKTNMINEMTCGSGAIRTSAVRIRHQVSHRLAQSCADVLAAPKFNYPISQLSEHPECTSITASVCNGSGPSLWFRVRVQPQPLPNRLSGLSINPNSRLGYRSMVISQHVRIGPVVSGSPSGSIQRFN